MKNKKKSIYLIDTTLRDGAQAAEVHFTKAHKEMIAQKLCVLNVNEIEAGIPIVSQQEISLINSIAAKKPDHIKISVWCRNHPDDIRAALQCKTDIVHISLVCSEKLQNVFNTTLDEQFLILQKNIKVLTGHSVMISVGLQDVFRSNRPQLLSLIKRLEQTRVRRIRLADSCGVALPDEVASLLDDVRSVWSRCIDFHAHNDVGVAAANSIAAIDHGADSLSVTINGLGERAGNCSLSDIAAIAEVKERYSTTLNYSHVHELSELVAKFSGFPLSSFAPFVGAHLFKHEAGIHVNALLKDPESYQPYRRGGNREINNHYLLGTYSGLSAIKNMCKQQGLALTDSSLQRLKDMVLMHVETTGEEISEDEIRKLYYELQQGVQNAG